MADFVKGLFGGQKPAQAPVAGDDGTFKCDACMRFPRTRVLGNIDVLLYPFPGQDDRLELSNHVAHSCHLLTDVFRLRRLCWRSRPAARIHLVLCDRHRAIFGANFDRRPGRVHKMVQDMGAHEPR